jgi:hypothetical protein
MGEVLTINEMESRYKDEWLLIEDPETNEVLQVLKGRVLWHGQDRDELYRKMLELQPRHSAVWYTGILPRNGHTVIL